MFNKSNKTFNNLKSNKMFKQTPTKTFNKLDNKSNKYKLKFNMFNKTTINRNFNHKSINNKSINKTIIKTNHINMFNTNNNFNHTLHHNHNHQESWILNLKF